MNYCNIFALRSKETITGISRYCLDVCTKEELQIFSNQISSTIIEFTMCDLFTVNVRLFTSSAHRHLLSYFLFFT
ncbi:Uncharacterized protein FWK35_00018273, partial [Aphis craccivora]